VDPAKRQFTRTHHERASGEQSAEELVWTTKITSTYYYFIYLLLVSVVFLLSILLKKEMKVLASWTCYWDRVAVVTQGARWLTSLVCKLDEIIID